nr:HNH endonuclease [uncultured Chitinophaga sp.]
MTQDIFNRIRVEHILTAIQEIDRDGVRKGRHSTTYDLVYNNKLYPPKYVLSLAAKHATGRELDPEEFAGGANTPAFQLFEAFNFRIVPKMGSPLSFWWVNHKQTGKVEVNEGYIWSPQKNNNGSTNQTYINLTKTALGDIIFSYADGQIPAVGKVIASVQNKERPAEFGKTGQQWDKTGWLVSVQWQKLWSPLVPKDHLNQIVPLLPPKYSPIQANGNGNQGVYLAAISSQLGNKLLSLIEQANNGTHQAIEEIDTSLEERAQERDIERAPIPTTQKQQLIMARVGQGDFRLNVQKIESKCRITGLTDKRLLIASHIKPWKDSSNKERLDGHNGLLLSPHIDKLFDKGWISFSDQGKLLVSKEKIQPILSTWSIDINMLVGTFTDQQKMYLEYHRTNIFKG